MLMGSSTSKAVEFAGNASGASGTGTDVSLSVENAVRGDGRGVIDDVTLTGSGAVGTATGSVILAGRVAVGVGSSRGVV